jgi:hypothetical protein
MPSTVYAGGVYAGRRRKRRGMPMAALKALAKYRASKGKKTMMNSGAPEMGGRRRRRRRH